MKRERHSFAWQEIGTHWLALKGCPLPVLLLNQVNHIAFQSSTCNPSSSCNRSCASWSSWGSCRSKSVSGVLQGRGPSPRDAAGCEIPPRRECGLRGVLGEIQHHWNFFSQLIFQSTVQSISRTDGNEPDLIYLRQIFKTMKGQKWALIFWRKDICVALPQVYKN